jgi:outer membrane protein/protease secretion system outer membrane protein
MTRRFNPVVSTAPFKKLVLSGLLLSCSTAALSMDLLQAYEAAKLQDATILAARATAQAGRENLPQARAQMLPNISASASYNQNNLTSTTPNFLGVDQTTKTDYPSQNQTLTLRQPVYRPFLRAQYQQAGARVDDANALLNQEEQTLTVRVLGTYFEAMLTHEQLDLVLSQRKAYTTQLDIARKSFAAGSGTRTDIDAAQAQLDLNAAEEIEARQNMVFTLRQLEILVNQPVDQLSKLNVSKLQLLGPQPNNLPDWIARAEQHSPQIKSLKAQLEVARLEVDKNQSGHYPTLDAIAQFSRSQSESVSNTQNRYNNASVGLQLNVPLFAGGAVSSSIRQALAARERAEQLLEAGRRDLGLRVHKEFRGLTENIPKISALEQALLSADQLLLTSSKSFQAGSRTVVDVLNAEQKRTVVLRDLAQARYIYLMSNIRLLALVGAADAEAVRSINQVLQP